MATTTKNERVRKLQQIDLRSEKVIAEFTTPQEAAEAVKKANGGANILLCAANNHMLGAASRTAYGYCWRFSK